MATIKLLQFLGIAPKVSPENLKETYAQTAENVKLYSGDLIPYPQPFTYDSQRYDYPNGEDPDTLALTYDFDGNQRWIVLGPVADVIDATESNMIYTEDGLRSERRFYYSDNSTLKQSSFYVIEKWWQLRLALISDPTADEWYNSGWSTALTNQWNDPQYFTLGIPPPSNSYKPVTTATGFTALGSSAGRNFKFSRDVNGVVTIKTDVTGATVFNYGAQALLAFSADASLGTIYIFGTSGFKFADNFSVGDTIRLSNATPANSNNNILNTGTLGVTITAIDASLNAITISKANSGQFSNDVSVTIEKIGGTATPYKHGLRTGDTVTVSGFSYLTGTSTGVNATTVNISITAHKFKANDQVLLTFTSGKGQSGLYTLSNVTTNTFWITIPNTASFSDWDGNVRLDMTSFNASNVEITKVDDYTFTYYRPGFEYPETANTIDGLVSLGGFAQSRSYVFTWITAWNEESIASQPSEDLFVREGQTVTVTGLPSAPPSGRNNITGIRIYRTLAAAAGTEYYRLKTLRFPATIYVVSRTVRTARIVTFNPHNLAEDDFVRLAGFTGTLATLNKIDAVVTNVVDAYTFEYTTSDSGTITPTGGGSAKVYYDCSQTPVAGNTQYWGTGGVYNFVDDFDPRSLINILETDDYDPPPDNLRGLVSFQNGILAAYWDTSIYFSEINRPHAWPNKYVVKLEYPIMGLASTGGVLLVVTTGRPYQITGADPANLSVQPLDAIYPCVSRRSVTTIPSGAIYASNDGLVVYRPGNIPDILTKAQFNAELWKGDLDPTTIVAEVYETCYVARHRTGMFVFHWDEGDVGTFTTVNTNAGFLPSTVRAFCYEGSTDRLFMLYKGTNAATYIDILTWNPTDVVRPASIMKWKSKVFKLPVPSNFGAARVIADYSDSIDATWGEVTSVWGSTLTEWNDQLLVEVANTVIATTWEGSTNNWEAYNSKWNSPLPITFSLFVNKALYATKTVSNSNVFRLPTGYKSDTFEVQVQGNVRVRMIQLAETPIGLKEV